MPYLLPKIFVAFILILAIFDPTVRLKSDKIPVVIFVDKHSHYTSTQISSLSQRISRIITSDGYQPVLNIIHAGMLSPKGLASRNHNSSANHNTNSSRSWLNQSVAAYLERHKKQPGIFILVSDFDENSKNSNFTLPGLNSKIHKCILINTSPLFGHQDTWIRKIKIYKNASKDNEIPFKISVGSTINTNGILSIYANNKLIDSRTVKFKKMRTAFHYTIKSLESPVTLLKATIKAKGDKISSDNSFSSIVEHSNETKVLYISPGVSNSHDKNNIKKNYHIQHINPEELKGYLLNQASYPSTIVLDNVSLASFGDDTLDRLVNAVKFNGVGLVVLGGNHAFTNGGYRKSQLERILPLISESGSPDTDIAIDFVIDKSGSMSSPVGDTTRFNIVKDSIINTLPTFNNYDKIGIVTFDNKTNILLRPTMHFKHEKKSLFKNIMPGGGSNLYPAIQTAMDNLLHVTAHKRAIVILTDGFVVHSDYNKIIKTLKNNHINIIVLAIGKTTNKAFLRQLSSEYDATVINVTNPVHLFKTLDITLQKYRNSIVYKNTPIVAVNNLPFDKSGVSLPDKIEYYNVTKRKISAKVYMQTATGDPILASTTAGIGNIIAFASGSSQISNNFLRGLISMTNPWKQNPFINVTLDQGNKWLNITTNILSHKNSDWDNTDSPRLFIRFPDSEIKQVQMDKVLPGEFKARIAVNQKGLYRIAVAHKGDIIQRQTYINNPRQIGNGRNDHSLYDKIIKDGLASPFSPVALTKNLVPLTREVHLRAWLSIISLLIYLLITAHENGFLNFETKGYL